MTRGKLRAALTVKSAASSSKEVDEGFLEAFDASRTIDWLVRHPELRPSAVGEAIYWLRSGYEIERMPSGTKRQLLEGIRRSGSPEELEAEAERFARGVYENYRELGPRLWLEMLETAVRYRDLADKRRRLQESVEKLRLPPGQKLSPATVTAANLDRVLAAIPTPERYTVIAALVEDFHAVAGWGGLDERQKGERIRLRLKSFYERSGR